MTIFKPSPVTSSPGYLFITPGVASESSSSSGLIHLQAISLVSEPTDMRAGMDTLMTKAVQQFGQMMPHHAYLFSNRTHNRLKLIVHDGFGLWLCSRRLNKNCFKWSEADRGNLSLQPDQLQALLLGLPWQQLGEAGIYRYA